MKADWQPYYVTKLGFMEKTLGTGTRVTQANLEEILSKLAEVDLQQADVEVDEGLLDAVGDQQQLATRLGTLIQQLGVDQVLQLLPSTHRRSGRAYASDYPAVCPDTCFTRRVDRRQNCQSASVYLDDEGRPLNR